MSDASPVLGSLRPRVPASPRPGHMIRSLACSFRYAFQGAYYVLKTQRNARIQMGIGLLAAAVGLWVGLTPMEWAVLVLTVCLVLGAEMANTALEALSDATCPNPHPLVKVAKDVAAGSVLVMAAGSVVVGLLILGPPLLRLLAR